MHAWGTHHQVDGKAEHLRQHRHGSCGRVCRSHVALQQARSREGVQDLFQRRATAPRPVSGACNGLEPHPRRATKPRTAFQYPVRALPQPRCSLLSCPPPPTLTLLPDDDIISWGDSLCSSGNSPPCQKL